MMRSLGAFTLCLAVLADLLGPAFTHAIAELKLHVPAATGGGWDQTARAMERALREEKLVTGPVRITVTAGPGSEDLTCAGAASSGTIKATVSNLP